MLELIGSTALSAFRKQRLLTKITQVVPQVMVLVQNIFTLPMW